MLPLSCGCYPAPPRRMALLPLFAALLAAGSAPPQLAALLLDSTADAARLRVGVTDASTGDGVGPAEVALSQLTFMPGTDEEARVNTAAALPLSLSPVEPLESEYSVDFASLFADGPPPHGLYRLDLTVKKPTSDNFPADGVPASVVAKVSTAIEPVGFRITTQHKAADASMLEYTARHPAAVPETVALQSAMVMTVELKVRSRDDGSYMQPHQTMVRLTSDSGQGRPIVLVAAPVETDPDLLQVKLDIESASAALASHSGDYTMQVVVGDFFSHNSIVWDVATVSLFGGQAGAENATKTAAVLAPRAIIEHAFREPELKPLSMLTAGFTGAALAPAAFLLVALVRAGASMKGCRRLSALQVACSIGFHACMAGLLYLTVDFWMHGTLLDTAGKLAPLAAASVVLGWLALREGDSSKEKAE